MTSKRVPSSIAAMPLRYNVWVFLVYIGAVIWLGTLAGGLQGVLCTVLTAMLSFQFWVYAYWRGLTAPARTPS